MNTCLIEISELRRIKHDLLQNISELRFVKNNLAKKIVTPEDTISDIEALLQKMDREFKTYTNLLKNFENPTES